MKPTTVTKVDWQDFEEPCKVDSGEFAALAAQVKTLQEEFRRFSQNQEREVAGISSSLAPVSGFLEQLSSELSLNRMALSSHGELIEQAGTAFQETFFSHLADGLCEMYEVFGEQLDGDLFTSLAFPLFENFAARFGLSFLTADPGDVFDPKTMKPARNSARGRPDLLEVAAMTRPGVLKGDQLMFPIQVELGLRDQSADVCDALGQQFLPLLG